MLHDRAHVRHGRAVLRERLPGFSGTVAVLSPYRAQVRGDHPALAACLGNYAPLAAGPTSASALSVFLSLPLSVSLSLQVNALRDAFRPFMPRDAAPGTQHHQPAPSQASQGALARQQSGGAPAPAPAVRVEFSTVDGYQVRTECIRLLRIVCRWHVAHGCGDARHTTLPAVTVAGSPRGAVRLAGGAESDASRACRSVCVSAGT